MESKKVHSRQVPKTCAEIIEGALERRIRDIEKVYGQVQEGREKIYIDEGYKYEDVIEWLNDYALAFSLDLHYRAKRLELSTGGPADGFRKYENARFEGDSCIEYYYQDWFDGATMDVDNKAVIWLFDLLGEV